MVGRVGNEVWLVAGGLPGETVEAETERRRASVVEAVAVRMTGQPHPVRVASPCPHAALCGGCDWPHVEPESGARLKAEVAAGAARGQPDLAARLRAAPVRASPPAWRLRARLHWDPALRRLGFYGPRTWSVAEIDTCRIISPRLARSRPILEAALAASCPAAVDLEWLEDLEGAAAVAALRRSRTGPDEVASGWVPPETSAASAVHGFHRLERSGTVVPGWGPTSVTMRPGRDLEVPIGSFFQGNRHLVRWLFDRVTELIGVASVPTFDLHGGVGFLAAAASLASDRPLTVVEPFQPAARAAARNLPEAQVVVGRTAEAWFRRAGRLPRTALAIVDPPRVGLSADLRRRLTAWHPDRILMLSCDPATWARDTRDLTSKGYQVVHLELVDLFPYTHHVEVVTVLETT
jgi:tRNA/tmRNA/rRNA uracil-C5-methylase (TrmA/RlmC/RlmD family)